jgi:hypothetical protein
MLRGYFTLPRSQIWTKPQFRVKNGRRLKIGVGEAFVGWSDYVRALKIGHI